jgi:ribosomal protein L32
MTMELELAACTRCGCVRVAGTVCPVCGNFKSASFVVSALKVVTSQ